MGDKLKVIWRFSDSKPGHDSQSMGLVKALCKLTGHEVLVIEIPGKLSVLLRSLFAKSGSNDYLPDPDILVGAGHSVHFSMIISRLFRGAELSC